MRYEQLLHFVNKVRHSNDLDEFGLDCSNIDELLVSMQYSMYNEKEIQIIAGVMEIMYNTMPIEVNDARFINEIIDDEEERLALSAAFVDDGNIDLAITTIIGDMQGQVIKAMHSRIYDLGEYVVYPRDIFKAQMNDAKHNIERLNKLDELQMDWNDFEEETFEDKIIVDGKYNYILLRKDNLKYGYPTSAKLSEVIQSKRKFKN